MRTQVMSDWVGYRVIWCRIILNLVLYMVGLSWVSSHFEFHIISDGYQAILYFGSYLDQVEYQIILISNIVLFYNLNRIKSDFNTSNININI
jgi:hypothetical protein